MNEDQVLYEYLLDKVNKINKKLQESKVTRGLYFISVYEFEGLKLEMYYRNMSEKEIEREVTDFVKLYNVKIDSMSFFQHGMVHGGKKDEDVIVEVSVEREEN